MRALEKGLVCSASGTDDDIQPMKKKWERWCKQLKEYLDTTDSRRMRKNDRCCSGAQKKTEHQRLGVIATDGHRSGNVLMDWSEYVIAC